MKPESRWSFASLVIFVHRPGVEGCACSLLIRHIIDGTSAEYRAFNVDYLNRCGHSYHQRLDLSLSTLSRISIGRFLALVASCEPFFQVVKATWPLLPGLEVHPEDRNPKIQLCVQVSAVVRLTSHSL